MKLYTLSIPDELDEYIAEVVERRGITKRDLMLDGLKLMLTADVVESEGESIWVRDKDSGELVAMEVFGEEEA